MAGFLPLQASFVLSAAAAQALPEHGGEVSARFVMRAYKGITIESCRLSSSAVRHTPLDIALDVEGGQLQELLAPQGAVQRSVRPQCE
jgi:hypothetical protein